MKSVGCYHCAPRNPDGWRKGGSSDQAFGRGVQFARHQDRCHARARERRQDRRIDPRRGRCVPAQFFLWQPWRTRRENRRYSRRGGAYRPPCGDSRRSSRAQDPHLRFRRRQDLRPRAGGWIRHRSIAAARRWQPPGSLHPLRGARRAGQNRRLPLARRRIARA